MDLIEKNYILLLLIYLLFVYIWKKFDIWLFWWGWNWEH